MTPITLNLPPSAQASNYLFKDLTIADRTQDMLTVRLDNGYFIDVGWYPEHDPNGEFWIRVFHEFWDRQKIDPIKKKYLYEVQYEVERLAQRYSGPIVLSSSCGAQTPSIFAVASPGQDCLSISAT